MRGHLMIEKLSAKQTTDATTASMPSTSGLRAALASFTSSPEGPVNRRVSGV
jgi:hypothetical protein